MARQDEKLMGRDRAAMRPSELKRLRSHAWWISAAFWVAELLLVQMIHNASGGSIDGSVVLTRSVWLASGLAMGIVIWRLMAPLHYFPFWKLAVLLLLAFVVLGSIHAVANRVFMFSVIGFWPPADALIPELYANTRYWLHFYIAWGATILALLYAMRVKSEEMVRSHAQVMARQAQIQAFRYQINPHFLFNTLNSISTLVIDQQWFKAEKLVRSLSHHLRRGLSANVETKVPLVTEVRHQLEYLEIEKTRLGDRLVVTAAIPETLENAAVPSLILLPLVENAVAHGVLASKQSSTIAISARLADHRLELTVANDAPAVPHAEGSERRGGGLDYVRGRLAARYGDEFTLTLSPSEPSGCSVRLSFPYSEID